MMECDEWKEMKWAMTVDDENLGDSVHGNGRNAHTLMIILEIIIFFSHR